MINFNFTIEDEDAEHLLEILREEASEFKDKAVFAETIEMREILYEYVDYILKLKHQIEISGVEV